MNELTAKTKEIRRLHAVCRAQRDAVRQAYRAQVRSARQANTHIVRHYRLVGRACGDDDRRFVIREIRDEHLYAARVLKEILTTLEG